MLKTIYSWLSLSRLWLSRITAYLEKKIWSLYKHRNRTSGNKILWIRGEIAPQEQFLPFSTIFSTYISNERSQITCSFVKFGSLMCICLNSANLICRSTDISKIFIGSLWLRVNESRLYKTKQRQDKNKTFSSFHNIHNNLLHEWILFFWILSML